MVTYEYFYHNLLTRNQTEEAGDNYHLFAARNSRLSIRGRFWDTLLNGVASTVTIVEANKGQFVPIVSLK